jgi:hypothetical protein
MTTTALTQNQPIRQNGIERGVAVVKLTHADLTDNDTSQTITWATLAAAHPVGASSVPANARIVGSFIRRITDFVAPTSTGITIDLGDAGNIDELIDGADVHTGAKATATFAVGAGQPDGIERWSSSVAFSDLGSGASDTIAIAGFPVNATLVGWNVVITTPWAGEADLAFSLGHTVDPDGLIVSFNLNAVAAGQAAVVSGALYPRTWADLSTSGLAWTFTATELDDVSAGAMRADFYVINPRSSVVESAYSPVITVVSVADNLLDFTAGECEICIVYEAYVTTSQITSG